MDIYKQIFDLSLNDFIKFPYWEFLSEDDENAIDECTVKGHNSNYNLIEGYGVVYTKFTFYDDSVYYGFVVPDNVMCVTQPNIFIDDDVFSFWNGIIKPTKNELKKFYNKVGKKPKQVFPIKWETLITIRDLPNNGQVCGFGFIKGKKEYFLK